MNRSESMNRYRCFESDISTSVESSHAAGALPQGFSGGSYWEVQDIGKGESGVSPPKLGGVAATSRKYPKLLIGADGVVPEPTSFEMHLERCRLWNHPAAAIRGSGFHLLTAAAAPPNS
jgi:hypothetical protein